MNIQPNSKDVRKYIPKDEYFSLVSKQLAESYIGLDLRGWAESAILKRLTELKELEDKGFIYLGEKNWLEDYLSSDSSETLRNYDSWVTQNFKQYLGFNFRPCPDDDLQNGYVIWETEIKAHPFLLSFPELHNPAYSKINELELIVIGTPKRPEPAHISRLFSALHNLEYIISALSSDTKGYEPLGITGVCINTLSNPDLWFLNVVSEYGSEFSKTIINNTGWRGNK
jgi:hypothetical protein